MLYDKMNYCFETMNSKINEAINNTDLKSMFSILESIEGPTLVCGVGGSSIVANFLAKVLREKNHTIATFVYPRDLKYMDLSGYQNIISVSYSGNNIGVDAMFETNLNKYLFTGNPKGNLNNIVYNMSSELSYVSINATMVPLSLLLLYYKDDKELLESILSKDTHYISNNNQYEVLSGYDSLTAGFMLESSITEAGFGTCVVHDKYNYCHGRINITRNCDADMIVFNNNSELDQLLIRQLEHYYKNIIVFDKEYDDVVINDYYWTLMSLKLIRNIAEEKNIDISDMNELEDNDILYLFKGNM